MKTKLFFIILLLAGVGSSAWAAPFTVSTDFTEVTDTATGLIWRRCAEGATPNQVGDCIGSASTLSHEAALGVANNVAASTTKAWRLPSVRELGSLLIINSVPSVDTAAFPKAPEMSTWTSSPAATDNSRAWAVDFFSGFIFTNPRSTTNSVRLVRSGP